MEVIPLAIDGGSLCEPDRLDCRKQLGLNESEIIGLCFGRFSDHDKMDLFPLVQAFQSISEGKRPWRLILAGAVHSESYLKMLQLWIEALGIADRVTLATNLSEKDKMVLYGSSDFFISLSDNPQETFGLTLLEAMASRLPLVVADFDGYREIVSMEVGRRIRTTWGAFEALGMLAPIMDEVTYHRYLAQSVCIDVEALRDALRFFYSNPGLCRQMGEAARDRFLKLYDYRVVIPQLEGLWFTLKENFHREPVKSLSDPMAMDVFRCFSHYVTQSVNPDMRVRLTDFGQRLLRLKADYPLLPEMGHLIDPEQIRFMMERTGNPVSVGCILKDHKGEDWRKRYALLWMLKHGILGLVGEDRGEGDKKTLTT
jgi:hypothetical protein